MRRAMLALRREYMKSADLPRVLEAQLRKAIEDEDTPAARLLLDFGGAMPEGDRRERSSGPQVIIYADKRRHPDAIDAIAD